MKVNIYLQTFFTSILQLLHLEAIISLSECQGNCNIDNEINKLQTNIS